MIKVAIIGYTVMLVFAYSCDSCMMNPKWWQPYYIWDQAFGGGFILWHHAFKKSVKYKMPLFCLFVFSVIRCLWNISCLIMKVNPADTNWTIVLFFCLLPVIYFTLFTPNGRVTNFLNKYLIEWQRNYRT